MVKRAGKFVMHHLALVMQTLYSLALMMFFSSWRSLLQVPFGSECVVLGNGPSLKKDVKAVADVDGRDLICVNDFALSDYFELLRPQYYVALDPVYWTDNLPETMRTQIDLRDRLFKALDEKARWPMVVLLPFDARASKMWHEFRSAHTNISIGFFNRTPLSGPKWFTHFFYRLGLGMPWAQNVLVAATFLAVNLGYSRIFLLGADHSWHEEIEVGLDSVLYLKSIHFYDGDEDAPRARWIKADMKTPFTIGELFDVLSKMFLGYMAVADYARYRGVQVLNATSHTYIDAFQRIQPAELQAAPYRPAGDGRSPALPEKLAASRKL